MHKPESILGNEMNKILWDFVIQMDHPIWVRETELVLINKKERTCHIVDFVVPADHKMKVKESKKLDNTWTLPESLKSFGVLW